MTSQLTDEYRRTSYEISQAIAPGWERWRARLETAMAPVRQWMAGALSARTGSTVLELAAAAGDTGFDVARTLGHDGRLISTDFSPAMLDIGRRRAAELGIENVEFRVMDAENLELDTDSVDAVLCRFGYMLMADSAAALAETRRVLRPGGRLALAVWAVPERNPFATVLVSALAAGGHIPPLHDGMPRPFSMANPHNTEAMLEAAGFASITVDEAPVNFRFHDVDDYLSFMADTTGPIAIALQQLSTQDRQTIASTLHDAISEFRTDGGHYTIPGAALMAVAS
jgi:ubiquinone/menaquinone biosynthesis C-methylase UbiE